jgi:hypothetical protein
MAIPRDDRVARTVPRSTGEVKCSYITAAKNDDVILLGHFRAAA